jgi:hypothetical protein
MLLISFIMICIAYILFIIIVLLEIHVIVNDLILFLSSLKILRNVFYFNNDVSNIKILGLYLGLCFYYLMLC